MKQINLIMMKSKLLIRGILVLAVIGISLISSCVQQSPQEPGQKQNNLINANLDTRFQLKTNQIAFIESESLRIKFLNVTEDSRCPLDVQCFWEGQVTIVVNIVRDDLNLGDFNLTSRAGHDDLAIKTFDGYSIKLIKVDPYSKTTQKIGLSDYVVSLMVSKNISTDKEIRKEISENEVMDYLIKKYNPGTCYGMPPGRGDPKLAITLTKTDTDTGYDFIVRDGKCCRIYTYEGKIKFEENKISDEITNSFNKTVPC